MLKNRIKLLICIPFIAALFCGCYKTDTAGGFEGVVLKGSPSLGSTAALNVAYTTAVLWSEVLANPKWKYKVEERGFVISTQPDPTYEVNDDIYKQNEGFGRYSLEISGCKPQTTYYVRSYAKSSNNIGYGEPSTFRTLDGTESTVIINPATNIGYTNATVTANVISEGSKPVTERGFVWSTQSKPKYDVNEGKSVNDVGSGVFEHAITGLAENTAYHVRAYTKSEWGLSYSDEITFTTLYDPITLTVTANGIKITMKLVEGGTFQMGQGNGGGDVAPVHSVTLSSYYIGETEVTQELWESVMGRNPSSFKGNTLPVESVSWNDCQEFITKLNTATGKRFRLPTEAEWEYAAKGGGKSKGYQYSGSNDLGSVGWYGDNSGSKTHEVKTKQSNELGLYDMSGNVWEWCGDWYGSYSSAAQTNPTGPASGSIRVYRGGSWYRSAERCRVAFRYSCNPEDSSNALGLRLALLP